MRHLEYYIVYYDEHYKRRATRNYLTKQEAEKAYKEITDTMSWSEKPKIYEYRY